jgi:hypothetical protein
MLHVPLARALLVTALVAASLVACGTAVPAAQPIVEEWRIGPAIACSDVRLPGDQCEMLQRRALAYAEWSGGTVSSWSMHEPVHVNAAGDPALYASGAGMPVAIILVRQPSGLHSVLMGCMQPTAPGQAPDSACP